VSRSLELFLTDVKLSLVDIDYKVKSYLSCDLLLLSPFVLSNDFRVLIELFFETILS
jgi:hypothetical protein